MPIAQKPTVGRIVHWVSSGHSLGVSATTSTCRAAIVTEVKNDTTISCAVFTTKGTLFYTDINYDEGKAGASWHWPEMIDAPTSSIYPASARTPKKEQPPGVASA